jgi:hypothetical protein
MSLSGAVHEQIYLAATSERLNIRYRKVFVAFSRTIFSGFLDGHVFTE